MPGDQAEQRAAALRGGGDVEPGGADNEAEANGTDVVGSAWGAAGFTFVSFAAGATIPILPFLFSSGTRGRRHRRGGGAVRHRGDSRRAQRRTAGTPGLRQLGIGAVAALVTYGLGRLFNTVVG